MKKPTVAEVKAAYQNSQGANGHFFERAAMRFFGDTMKSFAVYRDGDDFYLYRKPSARVNVFGTWRTAGRDYFGAWKIEADGGLNTADESVKALIYWRATQ